MSSDKKLMDFKSKEEVKEYMKKENAKGNPLKLIIYDLVVLDVTKFRHPGPAELIADNLGKDIQSDFDDQGHSQAAYNMI